MSAQRAISIYTEQNSINPTIAGCCEWRLVRTATTFLTCLHSLIWTPNLVHLAAHKMYSEPWMHLCNDNGQESSAAQHNCSLHQDIVDQIQLHLRSRRPGWCWLAKAHRPSCNHWYTCCCISRCLLSRANWKGPGLSTPGSPVQQNIYWRRQLYDLLGFISNDDKAHQGPFSTISSKNHDLQVLRSSPDLSMTVKQCAHALCACDRREALLPI